MLRAVEQERRDPGAERAQEPLLRAEAERAHPRMQAVGADDEVAFHRGPVLQHGAHAVPRRFERGDGRAEAHLRRHSHALVQHALDVAAHEAEPPPADVAVQRPAADREAFAPCPVHVGEARRDVVGGPERLRDPHPLRGVVARIGKAQRVATVAEARRAFEDDRDKSPLVQAKRQGQAGDARARDENPHAVPFRCVPRAAPIVRLDRAAAPGANFLRMGPAAGRTIRVSALFRPVAVRDARQEETMTLQLTPLHPLFAAEVSGLDLRQTPGPELCAEIDRAMDRYAVLVFRGQELDDDGQMAFGEALGPLETDARHGGRAQAPPQARGR